MRFVDYFDRVSVINLPERTDRRRDMEQELLRLGFSLAGDQVEFFAAIRPDRPEPFEKIGYKGCYLSHLQILERAHSDGLNNILIAEDDLALSPQFWQQEPSLVAQLQAGRWDLVQFGYLGTLPELSDRPLGTLQPGVGEPIGSHFYAVNGRAIAPLIHFLRAMLQRPPGHPDGGPMSPDGALTCFRQQHPERVCLIAHPSLGGQRSSASDVSPKWFDRVPGLHQLASVLREPGSGVRG
ncbi:MAG: hypothetical protein Fur0046_26310 [Cyanobacteria bacterium J069]|nr:MAG: glycosyltransferase family 25 protein [Cyanobacteria bacterium J069]